MQQVLIKFDITTFTPTPEQIVECRREYSKTIETAGKLQDFAIEHAEEIYKMFIVLRLLDAYEQGGIIGYHSYVVKSGINILPN